MVSLLGYKLWEYFTVLFDTIPKIMYFLYAALASALDAMQCLMRRLAGLDIYYVGGNAFGSVNGSSTVVRNQDPVLEFIYGILGIGDNAAAYTGLTTVFWSLAILGVIVLALSTMVAIIKAHYQEDASKTNPVTHLYTALKAILTFAIVPVVVIVGFWLSGFLLRTVDTIIAGSATSEALAGIYGTGGGEAKSYEEVFEPANVEGDESNKTYYSRYDFFQFGNASTTTTFSGILFRTCAHGANRIRTESYDYRLGQTSGERGNTTYYNFDIFGEWFPSTVTSLENEERTEAEREWTAYQIDYAFMNNLKLKDTISATVLYARTNQLITISDVDMFTLLGVVNGFSKYNVGLVWYYYNLWQFNFMIGFISILTCFVLFVNIILGLMQRLIKSAALFLIYPAVLGLNPLDEGAAFKKWRGEFMQQALMAFGSIIGMNLFFLVFPYLDNIKFFGFWPLDGMVNIVIITAGLIMIKNLIAFISGLVGGADAQAAGASASGEVVGAIAKGAALTMGAGSLALKAAKFVSPGAMTAATVVNKGIKKPVLNGKAKRAGKEADDFGKKADNLEKIGKDNMDSAKLEQDKMIEEKRADSRYSGTFKNADRKVKMAAKRRGLSGSAYDDWVNEHRREFEAAELQNADSDFAKNWNAQQGIIDSNGLDETQSQKLAFFKQKQTEATERQINIRRANYQDENGNKVPHAFKQEIGNAFRDLGGSIGKMFSEGFKQALPMEGLKKILTSGLTAVGNGKYDDKGEKIGEHMSARAPARTQEEYDARKRESRQARAEVGQRLGSVFGFYPPEPFKKKDSESDKLAKSSDSLNQVAASLKEATEGMVKTSQELKNAIHSIHGGSGTPK